MPQISLNQLTWRTTSTNRREKSTAYSGLLASVSGNQLNEASFSLLPPVGRVRADLSVELESRLLEARQEGAAPGAVKQLKTGTAWTPFKVHS